MEKAINQMHKHNCMLKKLLTLSSMTALGVSLFIGINQAHAIDVSDLALEKIACPVMPSHDIKITDNAVILNKSGDQWVIGRDGAVAHNGKFVNLTESAQEKATQLQTSIRKELPAMYENTQALISHNLNLLDGVIKNTLGANSQLRSKVDAFKPLLQETFDEVITKNGRDEFNFSSESLNGINDKVSTLTKQYGEDFMKVALSEIAIKQLIGPKDDRISLSDLQTRFKTTFAAEDKKARQLLDSTCQTFKSWQDLQDSFIN